MFKRKKKGALERTFREKALIVASAFSSKDEEDTEF
jgi:hypothetical protein